MISPTPLARAAAVLLFLSLSSSTWAATDTHPTRPWTGLHLMAPAAAQMPMVEKAIAGPLAELGVNTIVFEVGYRYAFTSHPELAQPIALTREQARSLSAVCRANGIRLIPLFNCLGHQSWAKNTYPLLTHYPEFDETPEIPKDNPDIYCRSWCPLHPDVNRVVFALLDELLEAFEADALHVGMDEVFLIGHDQCSRCRGKDPAELFARAVNDLHQHLVTERGVAMLLWGDRLLDDAVMGYGEWEASRNGTAGAVDHIPKDLVICDWHYEKRDTYPSVPFFLEKGFRCWPASWRNREAAVALKDYARGQNHDRMMGHLCTTWSGSEALAQVLLGEADDRERFAQARQLAEVLRACLP
jgi:hypothetical protein